MRYLFVFALMLLLPGGSMAKEAVPTVEDPQLEARVRSLAEELRCLVCQNESLAESHADLAYDLRREMRERMKNGMSDEEILDFMVQRYGDFVRFRPAVKPSTLLLWFGPVLILVGAIVALIVYLKRRERRTLETPMSEEDKERARTLLGETSGYEHQK